MPNTAKIDLVFSIRGEALPVDHGYLLYSAISRQLEEPGDEWLHSNDQIGIHLVRGRYIGTSSLALDPGARLVIRMPTTWLPRFLPLSGKTLRIGEDKIRIGIPQPHALRPAVNLYAHLVTTKNGEDEARFDKEVARQLAALEIHGKPQRGPRRVFRVKEKRVVAHSLLVTQLTAEESIRLQEAGVGGRRKLGCGVFVPWEGK